MEEGRKVTRRGSEGGRVWAGGLERRRRRWGKGRWVTGEGAVKSGFGKEGDRGRGKGLEVTAWWRRMAVGEGLRRPT